MQGRSPSDAIKPEVRRLSAYTLKHVKADVKLDQNENPYELPQGLKEEVARRVLERPWGRYPEFVPHSTTAALSKFTGWTEDGILIGNGSNELILAGLSVVLGSQRKAVIPQPTFTLYKLLSSVFEASAVTVICSPNNPTGALLPAPALERILRATSGLVFLDEAYHEFSGQTALTLLPAHPNLIVLRTFSKAMSMAGLRFGYLMAHPEIAREIHKAKLPYNVNVFTLAAAELVLERPDVMRDAIQTLVAERQRVLAEVRKRQGVEAFDSCTNFFLIRTKKNARDLFDALYAQGVLVRDVSSYPMLERALRVSVGKPEENNRFLNALDRALEMP
jgi:histidinol-phosphate/aromatic aminotransferase/cobyric acid decarboxylase-like protein